MKVYKRLKKAQEVANGSPVVQCGEFYIVGMAPFSEARIIDPEGYVTGNVTMLKLETLGNVNQILVTPEQHYRVKNFSSKNFDRSGKWVSGENLYPYPEDGGLS